jgi:hypothetical protein
MKSLFCLLALVTLISGLFFLSDKNSVFADSLAPCCNLGLCENDNPNPYLGPKCHNTSSVHYKPNGCEEIIITCKTCIDYTISNCVCGTGSFYCINSDGSMYYGTIVDCPSWK